MKAIPVVAEVEVRLHIETFVRRLSEATKDHGYEMAVINYHGNRFDERLCDW